MRFLLTVFLAISLSELIYYLRFSCPPATALYSVRAELFLRSVYPYSFFIWVTEGRKSLVVGGQPKDEKVRFWVGNRRMKKSGFWWATEGRKSLVAGGQLKDEKSGCWWATVKDEKSGCWWATEGQKSPVAGGQLKDKKVRLLVGN